MYGITKRGRVLSGSLEEEDEDEAATPAHTADAGAAFASRPPRQQRHRTVVVPQPRATHSTGDYVNEDDAENYFEEAAPAAGKKRKAREEAEKKQQQKARRIEEIVPWEIADEDGIHSNQSRAKENRLEAARALQRLQRGKARRGDGAWRCPCEAAEGGE